MSKTADELFRFVVNRRGDAIAGQLREYEGRLYFDLRKLDFNDNQKAEVTIGIGALQHLADGINYALAIVDRRGLLAQEGARPRRGGAP